MVSTLPSQDLVRLLQPFGGLLAPGGIFQARGDEPRILTRTLRLGDISQALSGPAEQSKLRSKHTFSAAGTGLNEQGALLPALGEGLERYCACAFTRDQFIVASAKELGKEALDLDAIPRCSKAELSHPKCPLLAPDKRAPMRWVRGLSLLEGRVVYIPMVMVYLCTGFISPSERIWIQITTGCAAHASFERALLNGILEVIERDAISITWLQQLPLPRIEIDNLPPSLADYWDCYQGSCKELEYVLFDATTDLGIPTVYGLQISPADRRLTTLVSCATALEPAGAVVKVLREMAACRIAFRNRRPGPQDWDEFTELFHGASFMAQAEQAKAFDFLLQSRARKALSAMSRVQSQDEKQALRTVLERLRGKGMETYAVDLSTDEALRVGMRVVRVLIPSLQPFSFHYRAQYLAHPRLYNAPKQMGYKVRREAHLNPWPQPFS